MLALAGIVAAQTLLTCHVDGEGPVRFGVPLPATALRRGLQVGGHPDAELQWRLLQREAPHGSERVWVELAISGASGRLRIRTGGEAATPDAVGPVLVRHVDEVDETGVRRRSEELRWQDGTIDRRVREMIDDLPPGEGGAQTTVSPEWIGRGARVRIPASFWRRAGVLPPADGAGRGLRRRLIDALPALDARAAPGWRGRGDYLRDDEVVTNLEFDTPLALLQLAMATGGHGLLERAWHSARHLVDVDREPRSGLPYRHGPDHRYAAPEAGHVWIRGLRLCALRFADVELLDAARSMTRSLAKRVRSGTAPGDAFRDRMRDEAWPLYELEAALRFEDLPPVRTAADRLAARILDRWDPAAEVLRYGEGETRGEVYVERLWLTLGIAVPALRAYAERSGAQRAAKVVHHLESRAMALLCQGRSGVPLQYRTAQGDVFGVFRAHAAAEAVLLLEGLSAGARRKALGRAGVRAGLEALLPPDADDLATRFTLIGRCRWVMR